MDPTAGILEIFAQKENVYVIGLVLAVMTVVVRVLPPKLRNHGWTARVLPVLPVMLAVGFVWIPGLSVAQELGFGDRLALGAIIGVVLAWGFKVYKQTIMGRDERIRRNPK
jgi:hypothetical protein